MILVFYWLFTLNEKEEEKEENRQRQPKIRLNDARNVIITWIYVVFFTQIGQKYPHISGNRTTIV